MPLDLTNLDLKNQATSDTQSGNTLVGLASYHPQYEQYLKNSRVSNPYATLQSPMFYGSIVPEDFGKENYDTNLDLSRLQDDYSIENLRGEQQGAAEQWAHGFGKFLVQIGTSALNTALDPIWGLGSVFTGGSYYDNSLLEWTDSVNQWAEEVMPNYRTKEQQENSWYSPVNLFSANLWADQFLKNMGFTAGTVAASILFSGGLGAAANLFKLGTGASALVKGVGGVMLSTAGEASIEAYHTKHDFVTAKQLELQQRYEQDMQQIDAMYGDSPEGTQQKAELTSRYEMAANSIDEAGTQAGNMDWLLTMAIGVPTNMSVFGKIFGGHDFGMAKKVARGELGNLKNPIQKGGMVAVKDFFVEGGQEFAQNVASKASGFANEQGIYDLYELGRQVNSRNRVNEIITSIGRGLAESVSDENAWLEFFIGGLTGALASVGEIATMSKDRKDMQKAIDYANSRISSGALKEEWTNLIRQQGTVADMERAAAEGKEQQYKNAKYANIVSDIVTFDKIGKLEEYKSFLQEASNHLSDKDIQSIVDGTSKTGLYFDENGNQKPINEIRNIIESKIQDNLNAVNKYSELKDNIVKNSTRTLSDEELTNLVWYKMAYDNKQERNVKMGDELKEYFKDKRNSLNLGMYGDYVKQKQARSLDKKIENRKNKISSLQKQGKEWTQAYDKATKELSELQDQRSKINIADSPNTVRIKELDSLIREKLDKQSSVSPEEYEDLVTEADALKKEQKDLVKQQAVIDKNNRLFDKFMSLPGDQAMLFILNKEALYDELYDVIVNDNSLDTDAKAQLLQKVKDVIDLNEQQNSIKTEVDNILNNPTYLQGHYAKIDNKYLKDRKEQQLKEIKERLLKAESFEDVLSVEKDTLQDLFGEAVKQLRQDKNTPADKKLLLKNYQEVNDTIESLNSKFSIMKNNDTLDKAVLSKVKMEVESVIDTAFKDSQNAKFIQDQLKELLDQSDPSEQPIIQDLLKNLHFAEQAKPEREISMDGFASNTAEEANADIFEAKTEETPGAHIPTFDVTHLSPEEYEKGLLEQSTVKNEGRELFKAIVEDKAKIVGDVTPEQLNLIKQIATRFYLDDGRERGNPIGPRADYEERYEDEGNSEVIPQQSDGEPQLRSWLYTKWDIESLKRKPQEANGGKREAKLFLEGNQPAEVLDLDNLAAFDFIEKGYLADLYNAYNKEHKDLPIKLFRLGEDSQDYQSLKGRTLLVVERDFIFNKLFKGKNLPSLKANDKSYQVVGILNSNKAGEDTVNQISAIVSNAHTNKAENFVYDVDMRIGHLYTGRMVLTNKQFPNLEERSLLDILPSDETPTLYLYYSDTDIKGPYGKPADKPVPFNTNNNNSRNGTIWLATKEADGKYYYKAIQVARYNDWMQRHENDENNLILNKLKQQFAILCDVTKDKTQRAAAKGIIEDIIYFPERLNFKKNSNIITFQKNPLNTNTSLEEQVNECLEALKDYNLHFQIRPHHLATRTPFIETIKSGILMTNLAQLHNVNASFDLVVPTIKEGKIVVPKQNNTRVTGHTGNPLNYQQSQKTQVPMGNVKYRIDDNTLEVFADDGTSVDEDTATEVRLRYKIYKDGNVEGVYEGTYNNGKKFYIKNSAVEFAVVKEGTKEYDDLTQSLHKEQLKENAKNIVKPSKDNSPSIGQKATVEQVDDFDTFFGLKDSSETSNSETNNQQETPQETLQPEAQEPSTSDNANMQALKQQVEEVDNARKKKEVGSDTFETNVGKTNNANNAVQQVQKSFIGALRKDADVKQFCANNKIANIKQLIDYCIQKDSSLDFTQHVSSAEDLAGWIRKNLICE